MEEHIKDYEWDVIFVNDGSPDRSGEILEELSIEDSCCRVIELSRNFGKEIALSAGADYATGDAVIFLDAELFIPFLTTIYLVLFHPSRTLMSPLLVS